MGQNFSLVVKDTQLTALRDVFIHFLLFLGLLYELSFDMPCKKIILYRLNSVGGLAWGLLAIECVHESNKE